MYNSMRLMPYQAGNADVTTAARKYLDNVRTLGINPYSDDEDLYQLLTSLKVQKANLIAPYRNMWIYS